MVLVGFAKLSRGWVVVIEVGMISTVGVCLRWCILRICAILGELHVVGFVTLFLSGHDRHAYLELILQREKHISLLRCEPNPIEAFTFSPFCGCDVQIVFWRDSREAGTCTSDVVTIG